MLVLDGVLVLAPSTLVAHDVVLASANNLYTRVSLPIYESSTKIVICYWKKYANLVINVIIF